MEPNGPPRRCCLRIFLALFAIVIAACAHAETIRVGGTGSTRGILLVLKEAYAKTRPSDSLFIVPPMGSSGGLRALQHGDLDIAVIARKPPAEFQPNTLKSTRLGASPFVIIANPNVPISSVSTDQLAAYFDGTVSTWQNGTPVRVVLRPQNDSDHTSLSNLSPTMEAALKRAHKREGMIYGFTDTAAADETENIAGAISTSTLTLVVAEKRKLKILTLNGVVPSIDNLKNGTYPHAKSFYLVTRAKPSKASLDFIRYIQSAEGQKLLRSNGILSLQ